MEKTILNVQGMSCGHCKKAVTDAVSAIAGVSAVEVNLEGKTVAVEFDAVKCGLEAIRAAITEEGFEVVA